jgi:excisionase family DNA binding protein
MSAREARRLSTPPDLGSAGSGAGAGRNEATCQPSRRLILDERASLLTIEDVATYLQVSARTVRRLIARSALPHVRFGRVIRFDPADVRRFLAARKG